MNYQLVSLHDLMNNLVHIRNMKAMKLAALFAGVMLLTWTIAIADNHAYAAGIGSATGPLGFWEMFFFGFGFEVIDETQSKKKGSNGPPTTFKGTVVIGHIAG